MKLLVFVLAVSCVSGTALVGDRECTWGPSYWCSRLTRAKQCGAVQHCLDTVWTMQTIKPQQSEACDVCELVFQQAIEMLNNKATEDEIAALIANACVLFPTSDLKRECKGIVTDDMPIVMRMLTKKVTPGMMCAILGVCSGLEDTGVHGAVAVKTQSNTTCKDCKKFITDVQQSITSKEMINQYEQLFEQVLCAQLPQSFKNLCVEAVETFVPSALQFLASQINPDVTCRLLGFCLSDQQSPAPLTTSMKNVFADHPEASEECEICEDLLTNLVSELRDQTVQSRIVEEVEYYVCGALGSLEAECKELVEQEATTFFDLLINELDPKTVCETLGLCKTPSLQVTLQASFSRVAKYILKRSSREDAGTPECELCLLGVQLLETIVANISQADIMSALHTVCGYIPDASFAGTCNSYVEQYGPLVINLLKEKTPPKEICSLATLCPTSLPQGGQSKVFDTVPIPESKVRQPAAVGGATECTVCKVVIQELDQILEDDSTKVEIETLLESVCDRLTTSYKDQCDAIVQEYAPEIIALIVNKADPATVCETIRLCTSAALSVQGALRGIMSPVDTLPLLSPVDTVPVVDPSEPNKEPSKMGGDTECLICRDLVAVVKTLLDKNTTVEEIKNALRALCGELPSSVSGQCQSIVTLFGDEIIKYLNDELDPDKVCQEIDLCTTDVSVDSTGQKNEAVSDPSKITDVECKLCNVIVGQVQNLLDKNTTEAEITEEVVKLCKILPSTELQKECAEFVTQYLDDVIKMLIGAYSPDEVCKELGLCDSLETSKEPSQMSSELECTACELLVGEVERLLKKNATEAEIAAELEKLCGFLPASMSQVCDEIINSYLGKVIKLLEQFPPEVVCQEIGLCSTLKSVKVASEESCLLCEVVVREIDSLLGQQPTMDKVVAEVEKLCSLLPSSLTDKCRKLIDSDGRFIIATLHRDLKPDFVCKLLKECSSSGQNVALTKLEKSLTKALVVSSTAECDVCMVVVNELDTLLQEQRTQAMIRTAIDKICTIIPSSYKTECETMVKDYSEYLINFLVLSIKPDVICKDLQLCDGHQVALPDHSKTVVASFDTCTVCKDVVVFVKNEITANLTEEEAEDFVKKVICQHLPDTVSQQCQDLVKQYVPAILAMAKQELENPDQVCKDLNLCNATAAADKTLRFKPAHRLGENKCTFGPAYWCDSMEKAKECNAVDHCTRHVWTRD